MIISDNDVTTELTIEVMTFMISFLKDSFAVFFYIC
jgi:hypothetical protein